MIISFDPGLSGAISWVEKGGQLVRVVDMPTVIYHGKRRINGPQVVSYVRSSPVDAAVIEGVGPHRGEGVGGAFSFGYGAGLLEGIILSHDIPLHIPSAALWKQRAGVPAEKDAARLMAGRLFPTFAESFERKKDDGRAECALMGRWAIMGGLTL